MPPAASTAPATMAAVDAFPKVTASFRSAEPALSHWSFGWGQCPDAMLSLLRPMASPPNTAPATTPAAPTPIAVSPSGRCHDRASPATGAGGVTDAETAGPAVPEEAVGSRGGASG